MEGYFRCCKNSVFRTLLLLEPKKESPVKIIIPICQPYRYTMVTVIRRHNHPTVNRHRIYVLSLGLRAVSGLRCCKWALIKELSCSPPTVFTLLFEYAKLILHQPPIISASLN